MIARDEANKKKEEKKMKSSKIINEESNSQQFSEANHQRELIISNR